MMNNQNFMEIMKSYMNPETFLNNLKNMQNVDFSTCSAKMKQNGETLTNANKICVENAQAIAKHATEATQKSAKDAYNVVKDILSSDTIEQAASAHHNYIKSTIEHSMASAKDIMDMSSQAVMNAFQLYGEHVPNCNNATKAAEHKGEHKNTHKDK